MNHTEYIKNNTTRRKITSRGGGIEISLDNFGIEGGLMSAYQNYLGGGLLGSINSNHNIPFVEESFAKKLDELATALKEHYATLLSEHFGCEDVPLTPEYFSNMPASAY